MLHETRETRDTRANISSPRRTSTSARRARQSRRRRPRRLAREARGETTADASKTTMRDVRYRGGGGRARCVGRQNNNHTRAPARVRRGRSHANSPPCPALRRRRAPSNDTTSYYIYHQSGITFAAPATPFLPSTYYATLHYSTVLYITFAAPASPFHLHYMAVHYHCLPRATATCAVSHGA